ncbi:pyridoxal phosphate-dependent transferase, partial [Chytridium lagenaria]
GESQRSRAYELESILGELIPILSKYLDQADELPYPASRREAAVLKAREGGSGKRLAALLDANEDGETIAPPSKLRAMFPRNLELPEQGLSKDEFWETVEVTLRESIRTCSPRFLDKLYSGTDAIGQMAELLTAVLNTNVHVYSVSPVFTLMELSCIKRLGSLVGFTNTTGVLQPGGSASNQLAMITARSILHPDQKRLGAARSGKVLTCFTSDHAHYSIEKAAMAMGLGLDGVVKVAVTHDGRMLPSELASRIMEANEMGEHPFFVNLTAATTVFSSFDPFRECVRVVRECEEKLGYRIWIHIDGSYGGPVVFSDTLRAELMDGCEDVDSITISPHKILGVPLQCSALLLNGKRWERRTMWKANGLGSSYLFHNVPQGVQQTKPTKTFRPNRSDIYGSVDLNGDDGGDEDGGFIRADSLKLFLSWAFHGTEGWKDRVELAFRNCRLLQSLLVSASKSLVYFELVLPDPPNVNKEWQSQRLSVSFWCVPAATLEAEGVKDVREYVKKGGEAAFKRVEGWTLQMHKELTRRGRFMVDYMGASKPEKVPKFLRVAISSSRVDEGLLRELVSELHSIAEDASTFS